MRFLIDNALSPQLSTQLLRAGHDVVHVRDAGLQSATDEAVIAHALAEDRVLVSADTDFSTLLALAGASTPSVVLFRRGTDRRPSRRAVLLLTSLEEISEPLASGGIVVFEEGWIRLPPLPIARAASGESSDP